MWQRTQRTSGTGAGGGTGERGIASTAPHTQRNRSCPGGRTTVEWQAPHLTCSGAPPPPPLAPPSAPPALPRGGVCVSPSTNSAWGEKWERGEVAGSGVRGDRRGFGAYMHQRQHAPAAQLQFPSLRPSEHLRAWRRRLPCCALSVPYRTCGEPRSAARALDYSILN